MRFRMWYRPAYIFRPLHVKSRSSETYTVMILPAMTSSAYSFSISRHRAKVVGSLLVVLLLLLGSLVVHYVMLSRRAATLDALLVENQDQRAQIATFLSRVDDLNLEMARLREFDVKLRIMTDLPPATLGVGGETPIAPAPGAPGARQGERSKRPAPNQEGMNRPDPIGRPDPTHRLDQHLTRLRTEVSRQAASFGELTRVVNHRTARLAAAPSIWPVRGWITSGYGLRVSPFTDMLAMHNGMDITAKMGSPFMAPGAGVVTAVGYDPDLGRKIMIDHGAGVETVYGHLSKTYVVVGQRVTRRQVIGAVGSTGMSTGPHLHYEVRVNRTPVNPLDYIVE